MHNKAVVFDYNRTIFNPDTGMLMQGAKEILDLFRKQGIPMFLVCKGDDERKRQIETLGLLPFFKKVIVNPHKSADDFRSCMKECEEGVKFFAVGDRVKEEIRHANVCGMTTIRFKNGKFANEEPESDEEKPHYTIDNLMDAADIILG